MRDGAASGDADGYARCSGGGEALPTDSLEAVRLVSMKSWRPLCFTRPADRWVGLLRDQKDSVG